MSVIPGVFSIGSVHLPNLKRSQLRRRLVKGIFRWPRDLPSWMANFCSRGVQIMVRAESFHAGFEVENDHWLESACCPPAAEPSALGKASVALSAVACSGLKNSVSQLSVRAKHPWGNPGPPSACFNDDITQCLLVVVEPAP